MGDPLDRVSNVVRRSSRSAKVRALASWVPHADSVNHVLRDSEAHRAGLGRCRATVPTRHALLNTVSMATVLVAFVALTFPSIGVGPYGPVGHVGCVPSSMNVSRFWTPMILLNSPVGGSSQAKFYAAGDGWSISASNGSADGLFELDNWSLDRLTTEWLLGPGPNAPCASAFGATDVSRIPGGGLAGGILTMGLLPENSTSDATELTHFSYPDFVFYGRSVPYPSVIFHNSFTAATETTYPACGGGAVANIPATATSSQVSVTVEFQDGPSVIVVNATVADSESFTYTLSPDATGTWAIDEVNAPGFAFAWTPC
jgi:hypothetical protein